MEPPRDAPSPALLAKAIIPGGNYDISNKADFMNYDCNSTGMGAKR